jgi:hypothetical protein
VLLVGGGVLLIMRDELGALLDLATEVVLDELDEVLSVVEVRKVEVEASLYLDNRRAVLVYLVLHE